LEDDVLPDGTKVKAGGMVTYVPYSMGRMEYNWGPDAASFKPERWLSDGFFQNASPFKFTAFQVINQGFLKNSITNQTLAAPKNYLLLKIIKLHTGIDTSLDIYGGSWFLFFCDLQAGPRICLGKDSAYLQMKMALAILCRFYKFSLVPDHPVKYRMMTILSMANGLKLTIARRS